MYKINAIFIVFSMIIYFVECHKSKEEFFSSEIVTLAKVINNFTDMEESIIQAIHSIEQNLMLYSSNVTKKLKTHTKNRKKYLNQFEKRFKKINNDTSDDTETDHKGQNTFLKTTFNKTQSFTKKFNETVERTNKMVTDITKKIIKFGKTIGNLTDFDVKLRKKKEDKTIMIKKYLKTQFTSCDEVNTKGVVVFDGQGPGMAPYNGFCKFYSDSRMYQVILRDNDKDSNYNRSWNDFKNGFGIVTSNFFIGLEPLYQILRHQFYELAISFNFVENPTKPYFLIYDEFFIQDEKSHYNFLVIGKAKILTGLQEEVENEDKLAEEFYSQSGYRFSTYDKVSQKDNCTTKYQSGWWYRPGDCGRVFLLGKKKWGGNEIENVEMAIRPSEERNKDYIISNKG